MDTSELSKIVTANVERLRDQLRLWEWHIDIEYERLGEPGSAYGTAGSVSVKGDYRLAVISLDGDHIENEEMALTVLRHELIHVFIWPMHAFGHWAEEKSGGQFAPEDHSAYSFWVERLVGDVERLLDASDVPLQLPEESEEEHD